MDFGKLLQGLKDSFSKPSILGNLVAGKQFNESLPRFGGVAPQNQMIQNPNIASPLQAPEEVTQALEHQDYLEDTVANRPPAPTPTPTTFEEVLGMQAQAPTSTPVPQPQNNWDEFSNAVREKVTPLGYNADAIIKQKALESAFGTSQFARERNNYGGIGAYDRDPNQAFKFDSVDEYLDYYLNLVKGRYPQAYENRANPEKFIGGLKAGGYASDPNYVSKVMRTPLRR